MRKNQLGFKTKQFTTLNEIQISIKIHVIQDSKENKGLMKFELLIVLYIFTCIILFYSGKELFDRFRLNFRTFLLLAIFA